MLYARDNDSRAILGLARTSSSSTIREAVDLRSLELQIRTGTANEGCSSGMGQLQHSNSSCYLFFALIVEKGTAKDRPLDISSVTSL